MSKISYGVLPIYCGPKQDFVFLRKNQKGKRDFFYGSRQDEKEKDFQIAMRSFVKQSQIDPNYFTIKSDLSYSLGKQGGGKRKLFLTFLKKGHYKYIKDNEDIKRVQIGNVDKYINYDKYKDVLENIQSIFVNNDEVDNG